jgi:hypothetical protein
MVLRRTFVLTKEEVAGGYRRLHNKELRNSYASPSFIKFTRSKRMRWMGHVTCRGEI